MRTLRPPLRRAVLRAAPLLAGAVLVGAAPATAAPVAQEQRVTVTRVPVAPASSGWLGIGFKSFTEEGAPRILLASVWPDGPAATAGLRSGDLLLEINGSPADISTVKSIAKRLAPGDPISLTVERAGREIEVAVRAEPRPPNSHLMLTGMQVQLDSMHGAITARLDSLGGPRAPRLPALRVRPVEESDSSITIFVMMEADSSHTAFRVEDGRGNPQVWTGTGGTVTLRGGGDGFSAGSAVWVRADTVRVVGAAPGVRSGAVDAAGTFDAPRAAELGVNVRIRGDSTYLFERSRPAALPNPLLTGLNRVAGAALHEVGPALRAYLGTDRGLLVTEVTPGTPAATAGLRAGDIVVRVDRTEVTTIEGLRRLLVVPSASRELTVLRAGERRTIRLAR